MGWLEGEEGSSRPQDRQWVLPAVQAAQPATRPTTGPTELIARLAETRAAIAGAAIADLGLADAKMLGTIYDTQLLPGVKTLLALRPPIIYLITTRESLKGLARGGWEAMRPHQVCNMWALPYRLQDGADVRKVPRGGNGDTMLTKKDKVQRYITSVGLEPLDLAPEAFAEFVRAERAKNEARLKHLTLRLD